MLENDCFAKINEKFLMVANEIEKNKEKIIDILTEIETWKTAVSEVEKTIVTLKTYDEENCYLNDRVAVGKVAVFLPYNMPLYSLVLYTFGPLYIGNNVIVRPSKHTTHVLKRILNLIVSMKSLDIEVTDMSSFEFMERCKRESDVVIFTGQWNSANTIQQDLPSKIKFIYCGSGVCPLIVRSDANIDLAVDVAIKSRLFNSGQDCLATEQILVQESIFDDFKKALLLGLEGIYARDNSSHEALVGEILIPSLIERAVKMLDDSKCHKLKSGVIEINKMDPIVIETTPDTDVFKKEKFTPIFAMAKYKNDDELFDIINLSEHALAITVIGNRFREGTFNVAHIEYNASVLDYEEKSNHKPFGGYKKSGFVIENGQKKEGPILFSYETSKRKVV